MPLRDTDQTGTAVYKVHTIGYGERKIVFKASVTLWPRPSRRRKVEHGEPAWREACGRALRRHGYRGEWLRSPWGRFGSFWKSLKNTKALRSEVRVLERWAEHPPWKAELHAALPGA